MDIKITKTAHPKEKPDQKALGFGKYMSDHMFLMDYTEGIGWHDAPHCSLRPYPHGSRRCGAALRPGNL